MKLNILLDSIIWDLHKLREIPDSVAAFLALEVTLQDWARTAHAKAEKLNNQTSGQ